MAKKTYVDNLGLVRDGQGYVCVNPNRKNQINEPSLEDRENLENILIKFNDPEYTRLKKERDGKESKESLIPATEYLELMKKQRELFDPLFKEMVFLARVGSQVYAKLVPEGCLFCVPIDNVSTFILNGQEKFPNYTFCREEKVGSGYLE